jgi:shikimate kinase
MKSIVLIGMPGAGKSTIGVLLARRLAMGFIDTDIHLQEAEGRTLQSIVDGQGYAELRRIEERVLCNLHSEHAVIATGGSAVYSEKAMAHLKQLGTVVYLRVSLEEILARVENTATRGLARRPGQTLEDLFHERALLYLRYADIQVDCDSLSPESAVESLCDALSP